VAIDNGAIIDKDSKYGIDINVRKTSRLVHDIIEKSKENLIIVGHLAPYVVEKEKVDLVCVLRRSPYEIIKTFEQRKYTPEKIRENTAGEILGITLYDSIKHFGKNKVSEFDTTANTPEQTADQIMSTLDYRLGRNLGIVDWLSLVAERGDLYRFLEYS